MTSWRTTGLVLARRQQVAGAKRQNGFASSRDRPEGEYGGIECSCHAFGESERGEETPLALPNVMETVAAFSRFQGDSPPKLARVFSGPGEGSPDFLNPAISALA